MVFTIRPYAERDAAACGECLYEGFFTAPIDHCDKLLLRDYAQVLIEKCNFTFVAEAEDGSSWGSFAGNTTKPSTELWQTDMGAKGTMACGAGCFSNTI